MIDVKPKKIMIMRFNGSETGSCVPYGEPVFSDSDGNEYTIKGITKLEFSYFNGEGKATCSFDVIVYPKNIGVKP